MSAKGGKVFMSKDFVELMRRIGETRSKDEELAIVHEEVKALRALCKENESAALQGSTKKMPKLVGLETAKTLREILVRLVYCEMLGQPVPFGYMLALNCTQFPLLPVKRTGYLATALFLRADHELTLLNTNTLRKALDSPNYLEVCAALSTLGSLLSPGTVPVFYPALVTLLRHPRAVVRKKAVGALHAALRTHPAPEDVPDAHTLLRDALCDKDPSVMVAALAAIRDLVFSDPSCVEEWTDLVRPLVQIQEQILLEHLPRGYDYRGVSAPWVQSLVLDLLGKLGAGREQTSRSMHEVLGKSLTAARASADKDASAEPIAALVEYAIARTIFTIVPSPELLDSASFTVGKFLKSKKANMRYAGIAALAIGLRSAEGKYASVLAGTEERQIAVVDCLEAEDESIRRQALDVLYRMARRENAEMITQKLLEALRRGTHDPSKAQIRAELAEKIALVAEKYAPSKEWYLKTFAEVLDYAGDLAREDIAETLIATCDQRRTPLDTQYAKQASDLFAERLTESLLPGSRPMPLLFARVACWVLGEHGHRCSNFDVPSLMRSMVELGERNSDTPELISVLVTALAKLAARCPQSQVPPSTQLFISRYKESRSLQVQQRAIELSAALSRSDLTSTTADLSKPVTVDKNLSFLQGFISTALANGAKPYKKPTFDDGNDLLHLGSLKNPDKLTFEAYPTPKEQKSSAFETIGAPLIPTGGSSGSTTTMNIGSSSQVPSLVPVSASGPESLQPMPTVAEVQEPKQQEPQQKKSVLGMSMSVLSSSSAGIKQGLWTTRGFVSGNDMVPPSMRSESESESTSSDAPKPAPAAMPLSSTASSGATLMPMNASGNKGPAATETHQNTYSSQRTTSEADKRRANTARSLFGPMSSSARAPQQNQIFASATTEPEEYKPVAPPKTNAMDDLLGLGDTTPSQPQQQQQGGNKLMDELFGDSTTLATPSAKAEEITALFGQKPASLPSSSPAATSSSFSFINSSSEPSASYPKSVSISDLESLPFFASQVKQNLPADTQTIPLTCENNGIGLYSIPIDHPDCRAFAIVLSAGSPHETHKKISLSIGSVPNFHTEVIPGPSASSSGMDKLLCPSVPPRFSILGLVKLLRTSTAVPSSPVSVPATFSVSESPVSLTLGQISVQSILRPLRYTTDQIRSVWGKHKCEEKFTIAATTIQEAVLHVERTAKAHCVSVIGQEAILSAVVACQPPAVQYVLFHCRCDGTKTAALVRTQDQQVTHTIAECVKM